MTTLYERVCIRRGLHHLACSARVDESASAFARLDLATQRLMWMQLASHALPTKALLDAIDPTFSVSSSGQQRDDQKHKGVSPCLGLASEMFLNVLDHLSAYDKFKLMRVSRSWLRVLCSAPLAWRFVDVTAEVMSALSSQAPKALPYVQTVNIVTPDSDIDLVVKSFPRVHSCRLWIGAHPRKPSTPRPITSSRFTLLHCRRLVSGLPALTSLHVRVCNYDDSEFPSRACSLNTLFGMLTHLKHLTFFAEPEFDYAPASSAKGDLKRSLKSQLAPLCVPIQLQHLHIEYRCRRVNPACGATQALVFPQHAQLAFLQLDTVPAYTPVDLHHASHLLSLKVRGAEAQRHTSGIEWLRQLDAWTTASSTSPSVLRTLSLINVFPDALQHDFTPPRSHVAPLASANSKRPPPPIASVSRAFSFPSLCALSVDDKNMSCALGDALAEAFVSCPRLQSCAVVFKPNLGGAQRCSRTLRARRLTSEPGDDGLFYRVVETKSASSVKTPSSFDFDTVAFWKAAVHACRGCCNRSMELRVPIECLAETRETADAKTCRYAAYVSPTHSHRYGSLALLDATNDTHAKRIALDHACADMILTALRTGAHIAFSSPVKGRNC